MSSHARGGEINIGEWKSISEFALWYEVSDNEIVEIETSKAEDDDDEDDLVNDVILGLQEIKEQSSQKSFQKKRRKNGRQFIDCQL